eukprot:1995466-Rhodomonas_salina.1
MFPPWLLRLRGWDRDRGRIPSKKSHPSRIFRPVVWGSASARVPGYAYVWKGEVCIPEYPGTRVGTYFGCLRRRRVPPKLLSIALQGCGQLLTTVVR